MNITVRTQTDISFLSFFLAVFFFFILTTFFFKGLGCPSPNLLRKFPLAPILTTDHVQDVRGVCVFGAGGGAARRRRDEGGRGQETKLVLTNER